MLNNFPPSFNPELYSFSAFVVGAILTGDLTALEQNSVGNWMMLVGQYMVTYASQQALIEGRIQNHNININSKQAKSGGSPYTTTNNKSNQNQQADIDLLIQQMQRIEQELQNIKKNSTP